MRYLTKLNQLRKAQPVGLTFIVTLVFVCGSIFSAKAVCIDRDMPSPRVIERPNIILIMADDLGYGDLGSYGQTLIRTPRLDRMASEGMRFANFYSGSSICAPSRCSLLTGLHQGHASIRGNSPFVPLRQEDVTIGEVMKAAGYKTGVIGKWGMGEVGTTGSPLRKGFDYSFGFLNHEDAHDHYPEFLWRNEKRVNIAPGAYAHDLFTKKALKFIKRERANPFFLCLAYTIPHGPFEVPDEGPYKNETWPQDRKNYAAMITRMDSDIGRILNLLKQLEIDDDTVVFFTSDNGPLHPNFFRSAGSLKGTKRDIDEGGIRVPMIARWPGKISPGQVEQRHFALWDFFPTVADIGCASYTNEIDGISFLPALFGNEIERAPLYWELRVGARLGNQFLQAVRMDRWKAISRGIGQPVELYDLEADEGEIVDLSARHPDIVERMKKIMMESHVESEIWPSN